MWLWVLVLFELCVDVFVLGFVCEFEVLYVDVGLFD